MFRSLRVKQPEKIVPDSPVITGEQLNRDPSLPITFRQINNLPENARKRIYRALLPPALLAQFRIDPVTWKGPDGNQHVQLSDGGDTGSLAIAVQAKSTWTISCASSSMTMPSNGVDLEPDADQQPGKPALQRRSRRARAADPVWNCPRSLDENRKAVLAGLAPGQARPGLISRLVFGQIESFLGTLGHRAYF
jgi:hypothetical protein